jgi:hypothetical protein
MKLLSNPTRGWLCWPQVWPKVALLGVLGLWLNACNYVRQDEDPTPNPLPLILPAYNSNLQTGQSLTIEVDSLVPRPGEAYTFSFKQPVFGRLVLSEGIMTYTQPQSSVVWEKDSAQYTICQNGSCGKGILRFKNISVSSTCLKDADSSWYVSALSQKEFILPSGARITSFSADNYTADTLNGQTLRYIAAGNLLNFGYDVVRYSYTLSGQCHQGQIQIVVGDSCQAGARNGRLGAPTGTRFITRTELVALAKGCRNLVANGVFSTTATGLGHTHIATPYGSLVDTVIGSTTGIYYRRLNTTSTRLDTAIYFFTSAVDERITRASLILTP